MEATKQSTQRDFTKWMAPVLRYGIAAIFVVAPFYAPLTVLLASHFRHFDFLRIWKEFALAGLGLVMVAYLVAHRRRAVELLRDKLFVSMLVYATMLVGTGAYDLIAQRVTTDAVIYGLLLDLRLVGFMGLVLLAFRFSKLKNFPWRKLILIPALIVVGFGFLQATVLPRDVLSHIGYSKQTIVPYQTVDNRPDFVRVQSTLRGANPLGAYLVVIITLLLSLLPKVSKQHRIYYGVFIAVSLVVLFATYSRSAWIGMAISLGVLLLVYERRKLGKKGLLVMTGIAIVFLLTFALGRNSYLLQNVLFHSSNKSTAATSSNNARASALQTAYKDVVSHPLGGGVGSAGPASLRNQEHPAKIAESYFLQIGQEVGVLGLVLFVLVQVLLIRRLWQQKDDPLSRALLASFIGLIFVNLISHAWSDDTLAYIWWGLAGIALAPPKSDTIDKKRKRYGQAKISTAQNQ